MDIASLIAFGILLLAWMVLPVKGTESELISIAMEKLAPGGQVA